MSMDYLSFIKLLAENALRNFTYNYNIISEKCFRECSIISKNDIDFSYFTL